MSLGERMNSSTTIERKMLDTFSQSSLQLKLGRDCGLYWLDALPTTATPHPQPHTQMLQLWDQEGKAWQLCRCKEPSSDVTVAAQAVAAPRSQSQAPAAALAQPAAPVSLCSSAFSSQGAPCAGEEWVPSSCGPQAFWYTSPYLLHIHLPVVDHLRNGIYWKRGQIGQLPQESQLLPLFSPCKDPACLSSHLLYTACHRAAHSFRDNLCPGLMELWYIRRFQRQPYGNLKTQV